MRVLLLAFFFALAGCLDAGRGDPADAPAGPVACPKVPASHQEMTQRMPVETLFTLDPSPVGVPTCLWTAAYESADAVAVRATFEFTEAASCTRYTFTTAELDNHDPGIVTAWEDANGRPGGHGGGSATVTVDGPVSYPPADEQEEHSRFGFASYEEPVATGRGQVTAFVHPAQSGEESFAFAMWCDRPFQATRLQAGLHPEAFETGKDDDGPSVRVFRPGVGMATLQPEARFTWSATSGEVVFLAFLLGDYEAGQGTLAVKGPAGEHAWPIDGDLYARMEGPGGDYEVSWQQATATPGIELVVGGIGCLHDVVDLRTVPDCTW